MTDPKATLLQLNQNLNLLQEREAKFGDNAPLELLNQISDHQQAIDLTRQVITGELDEMAWHESLKPLLLACRDGQVVNIEAETYIAGDQIITHIYESPPPPLSPAEAKERRELDILLNKVKQFWIEGVLEKSVHQMALIDLGKETQAEAVAHAWEQVLELPDQSRQTLPPNKKISRIFDEMNRALLILGEPGSGKTTTLLQLVQDLITQSEVDKTFSQPVPVVFNLSSWTDIRQPLIDWLVAELTAKYQIPKRIGRPWLENNRLLPLLDGLDEVKPDNQAACVTAINQFGEEFGLAGLVVCSRLKEYARLSVRLKLNGAIRLQPLTLEQIYNYLDGAGSKLDALRTALQTDDGLQEMARSPLILGIMTLAYQNVPIEAFSNQAADTIETRRKHLFDTYIERMFRRKGIGDKPYSDEQTKSWLSWLAQEMVQHNHAVFLIERLQPSWLPTGPWRWLYTMGSRLMSGLIGGLSFGLIVGLSGGRSDLLPTALGPALTLGLMGGLVVGLIDTIRFERGDANLTAKVGGAIFWRTAVNVLVVGLVVAFIVGLVKELEVGLFVGLIFGLIFGVRGTRQSSADDIQTVEVLNWSWVKAVKGGFQGLIYGLVFGLLLDLIYRLIRGQDYVPDDHQFIIWLSGMLSYAVFLGLVFGLVGGLSSKIVSTKTTPNQGIKLTLRNALYAGFLFGLSSGLIVWLTLVLAVDPILSLIIGSNVSSGAPVDRGINLDLWVFAGLLVGLLVGLIGILWYGGLDIIQHITLRLILWRKGFTPRNYVRFLDYVTERVFLQKVGGGYIFIHRLLLEHFAAMSIESRNLND